MTSRTQWAVVAAMVAALGIGLFTAVRVLGDEIFPVEPGRQVPMWSARTLDGSNRVKTRDSYAGQVVVLNVWATWCLPCRVEMPSLEALHQAYADSGLRVVSVSIDTREDQKAILDFAKEYKLTFELLHDPTRQIQSVFQTTGVPETFVIGADGIIRRKMIGAEDWNSPGNRSLVAQLLRERARRS